MQTKLVVTEFYFKKWSFETDEGSIRIAAADVSDRDSLYYVKTDLKGNRIIKGFIYNGKKQDFWTYYDTKGNISKIEFYVHDKITQSIIMTN